MWVGQAWGGFGAICKGCVCGFTPDEQGLGCSPSLRGATWAVMKWAGTWALEDHCPPLKFRSCAGGSDVMRSEKHRRLQQTCMQCDFERNCKETFAPYSYLFSSIQYSFLPQKKKNKSGFKSVLVSYHGGFQSWTLRHAFPCSREGGQEGVLGFGGKVASFCLPVADSHVYLLLGERLISDTEIFSLSLNCTFCI